MSLTKMAELSMSIADLTCCAICLESFTRPKVLPCQHTYCYCCLLSLCPSEKQTQITCPQCREKHTIPKGGISNFKDNITVNNLLKINVPKEKPCSDCQLKPSLSECEHCNAEICTSCLVEHIKLSMELTMSLKDVKENMAMPKSDGKKEKLKISREEWSEQMKALKVSRKQKLSTFAQLYQDSSSLENFMRIIGQVYEDLSAEKEEVEEFSYCTALSQTIDKCTTIRSLKDLKSNVGDLRTIVRLLQGSNDDFRFVPAQRTDAFGHIEIGQAIMDIRGRYESEVTLDEIFEVFPGLQQKFEQEVRAAVSRDRCSTGDHATAEGEVSDWSEDVARNIVPETSEAPQETGNFGAERVTEHDAQNELNVQVQDADWASVIDEPVFEPINQEPDFEPAFQEQASEPTQKPFFEPASEELDFGSAISVGEPVSKTKIPHLRFPVEPILPSLVPPTQFRIPSHPPLPHYHQNQLPTNVNYKDKGKGEIPTIGSGKKSKAPKPKLSNPQGIAYDVQRGEILVADSDNDRVSAYPLDGGKGELFYDVEKPHDVAISSDGLNVYIAIFDGFIKVTIDGDLVKTITSCSLGNFKDCCSIACHKEFTVLVSGAEDKNDREIRPFGAKYLKDPTGIGLSQDGTMYITDDSETCIRVFKWNEKYLHDFLDKKENRTYGEAAVDGDDLVCVSTKRTVVVHTIDVYDQNQQRLAKISRLGNLPNHMRYFWRLTLTPDGRIIVADRGNHCLQVF